MFSLIQLIWNFNIFLPPPTHFFPAGPLSLIYPSPIDPRTFTNCNKWMFTKGGPVPWVPIDPRKWSESLYRFQQVPHSSFYHLSLQKPDQGKNKIPLPYIRAIYMGCTYQSQKNPRASPRSYIIFLSATCLSQTTHHKPLSNLLRFPFIFQYILTIF